MFQIKICGITNLEDAILAADAGADAIGLNFYSRSPRCVALDVAREIVKGLPDGLAKVGIFVNASATEIREIAAHVELDWIQLHGDEPPEFLDELADLRVVRAIRMSGENNAVVPSHVEQCLARKARPEALLVDAAVEGEYGGTGAQAPWRALATPRDWAGGLPLILAGGLRAENVAEAIRTVRPQAVDTASGVESSPGKKEAARVRAFVAAARAEFSRTDAS